MHRLLLGPPHQESQGPPPLEPPLLLPLRKVLHPTPLPALPPLLPRLLLPPLKMTLTSHPGVSPKQ